MNAPSDGSLKRPEMYFHDLDPGQQKEKAEFLIRQYDLSRDMHFQAYDRLLRYLITVNGAGAISTLGFIGSAQSLGDRAWAAVLCLASFAVGVTICGAFLFRAERLFHRSAKAREKANNDFFSGIKTEEAATEALKQQRPKARSHLLFWATFLPFISGLIFGTLAVWPN